MKDATPGPPLEIVAKEWNDVRRSALREIEPRQHVPDPPSKFSPVFVQVKNNSGAAVDIGGIMGIEGPQFTLAGNAGLYRKGNLSCGTPDWFDDIGNFVVAAIPLSAGQLGPAILRGVAAVTLYRRDYVTFDWCDIVDRTLEPAWPAGMTLALEEKPQGSAQILWRDEANITPIATGLESLPAYVVLGSPREAELECKTNEEIMADGVGEVEFYDAGSATGYTFQAALDWMHGGKSIATDIEVIARWVHHYSAWRLRAAECP